MKCVICKYGETEMGTTTITLERDNLTLVIKGVPARICENCGEEYVLEDTASRLLQIVEEAARAGVEVDIRQYAAA